MQDLDELLLREHGRLDERILHTGASEKVLSRSAHETLREAGYRAGERLEIRRQPRLEPAREVNVREGIRHLGRHRFLDRRIRDQLLRGLLELTRVERLPFDVRREDAHDGQQDADDKEHASPDDAAPGGRVDCRGGGHGEFLSSRSRAAGG